jgi:predicted nucleotidyltransferase
MKNKQGRPSLSVEAIREGLAPLFCEETLKLVILFGSTASGKTHRKSDIDLAFLYTTPIDRLTLANQVIRLLRTDRVDVVDLRRASPLVQFAVAQTGQVLFERAPGAYPEFCSLAFRRYVDTKKLRDARALVIRRFLDAKGAQ